MLIVRFKGIVLFAAGALLLALSSCGGGAGEGDSWQDLLAESDRLAAQQQWEPAAEYALEALSAGDLTGGADPWR